MITRGKNSSSGPSSGNVDPCSSTDARRRTYLSPGTESRTHDLLGRRSQRSDRRPTTPACAKNDQIRPHLGRDVCNLAMRASGGHFHRYAPLEARLAGRAPPAVLARSASDTDETPARRSERFHADLPPPATRSRGETSPTPWLDSPRPSQIPSACNAAGEKYTGQSTALRVIRAGVCASEGGTVRTGHRALRSTFSATEPSVRRSHPLRPCVAITRRSPSVASTSLGITSVAHRLWPRRGHHGRSPPARVASERSSICSAVIG